LRKEPPGSTLDGGAKPGLCEARRRAALIDSVKHAIEHAPTEILLQVRYLCFDVCDTSFVSRDVSRDLNRCT